MQHLGAGGGKRYCYRSNFEVVDVQVGESIAEQMKKIPSPKHGDQIYDARFGPTISYKYDEKRTDAELLRMAEERKAQLEMQQEDKKVRDDRLLQLVGKPMLPLPNGRWLNGGFPDAAARANKPLLLHFWFTECAPCKNDYPILRKLGDRFHVIGIHVPTDEIDKVRGAIAKAKMNYPTLIAPRPRQPFLVAGWPVSTFPTCIVVEKNGRIGRFGSLQEVLGLSQDD